MGKREGSIANHLGIDVYTTLRHIPFGEHGTVQKVEAKGKDGDAELNV